MCHEILDAEFPGRSLAGSRRGGLMTTEQLMEKVLQDIKRMSREQKAKVRQELDKAFPPQKKTA
jgi:hypothetical protein